MPVMSAGPSYVAGIVHVPVMALPPPAPVEAPPPAPVVVELLVPAVPLELPPLPDELSPPEPVPVPVSSGAPLLPPPQATTDPQTIHAQSERTFMADLASWGADQYVRKRFPISRCTFQLLAL
jgi:hypothetical protein